MKKKILFFTGAGVSKESGIDTFRDKGGLWENYDVAKVATPKGWRDDPQLVIDFYNMRRKEMAGVKPNLAHDIIAELEKDFDVTVVTQNIDDLHEKAGSTNVIHLHGNLQTLRSEYNREIVVPWEEELALGQLDPNGNQLRPNVVWFGESLHHRDLGAAYDAAIVADICVIVGTSMQVSPANEIPFYTAEDALIYYIDPAPVDFLVPMVRKKKKTFKHYLINATDGMKMIQEDLKKLL